MLPGLLRSEARALPIPGPPSMGMSSSGLRLTGTAARSWEGGGGVCGGWGQSGDSGVGFMRLVGLRAEAFGLDKANEPRQGCADKNEQCQQHQQRRVHHRSDQRLEIG